jgi:hypothetical protein
MTMLDQNNIQRPEVSYDPDYFIARSVRVHTPAAATFKTTYGRYYGYVKLDVDGTVDGVTAAGETLTGFPIKGGIWDSTLFQSITAITTAAACWIGFPATLVHRNH